MGVAFPGKGRIRHLELHPEGKAAGIIEAAAPQLIERLRPGDQGVWQSEGIPAQLPVVAVGHRLSPGELQRILLGNLRELLYHLLGVDIVGTVFLRSLEFPLGCHVDVMVRIIAFAEVVPLLRRHLLRGVFNSLEGQHRLGHLHCLMVLALGINPGRACLPVFVKL